MNLNKSSNFILATHIQGNITKLTTYSPCNCKEKYQFKENSRLLPYLQTCKGWINDKKGYTLNYILIVLLAILAEQELIYHDKALCRHMVRLNSTLRRILLGINNSKPWCSLHQLKSYIARYSLIGHRKLNIDDKNCYFKCPRGTESLIISMIGNEGMYERYFHYSSQCV